MDFGKLLLCRTGLPILFLSIIALPARTDAQRRLIELEVSASSYEPFETQQRWMKLLTEIGVDRVRSKTAGSAQVGISEVELASAIRVKITAAIDNGKLILPGKSFTIRQRAEIQQYIAEIRSDGAEIALAEKKAFGLTSRQLVAVNQKLAVKIQQTTAGESVRDTIANIGKLLGEKFRFDATAKRAVSASDVVADELLGLSAGTGLAAVLRPLGLVLAPGRGSADQVVLQIVGYDAVDEHWPIGWPASFEAKKNIPNLYEKYPIEIRNFPLNQALSAIQSRCAIPMLFDYNSIAAGRIDLRSTNITFVKERSSYVHALGKILNKTKPRMDFEIRVDELGQPFFWISTANPIK